MIKKEADNVLKQHEKKEKNAAYKAGFIWYNDRAHFSKNEFIP